MQNKNLVSVNYLRKQQESVKVEVMSLEPIGGTYWGAIQNREENLKSAPQKLRFPSVCSSERNRQWVLFCIKSQSSFHVT